MKMYLFVTLFAIMLSATILEGQEKYLTSPVTHVTVFRQGAQLSGDLTISVQAGTTDFVAGGLSPYIDPNSILVRGEGDFMIMGVNHRNNYLENPAEAASIKDLRDRIDALEAKIEDESTAVEVLQEKELFLKSNYDVVTNKSAITPEQLRALLDIYSTNTEAVKTALLKKKRIIKAYLEEKQQLEQQLASSVDKSKLPTGEIVVTVTGTKPATGRINLSYVVMNAGWQPSYDIRVDDITDPASIIYKANIWQNSGIDWKDVKLSLSNASPMTAGSLPTLEPWFIDIYQPFANMALEEVVVMGYGTKSKPAARQSKAEEAAIADDALSAPLPVTVSESNISFSFDVNVPQTIMSGGTPGVVELQRLTVPATYSYAVTPKLASSAYLVGYITDWEKYNLLPGESNIYFSNTFTGKGYINTAELTDTLPVSLGADNNITVKRDRRTDYTSQKLIGANKVDTKSFLISVRNNKSKAVTVKLRDQIPLSQNSDITVEAVELTGGKLNPVTGEITWDLSVGPRENKEIILTYSVKYPKNEKVILE
ncbi:mucoidy inhibitor MuiA family protein [bacterium]|nr:mucoidy inhibitor MuiA family protein [bacterium]